MRRATSLNLSSAMSHRHPSSKSNSVAASGRRPQGGHCDGVAQPNRGERRRILVAKVERYSNQQDESRGRYPVAQPWLGIARSRRLGRHTGGITRPEVSAIPQGAGATCRRLQRRKVSAGMARSQGSPDTLSARSAPVTIGEDRGNPDDIAGSRRGTSSRASQGTTPPPA